MSSLVVWNFRLAVLVTVLGGLAIFAGVAGDDEAVRALHIDRSTYTVAAPLLLAVLTTILWFVRYRDGDGQWPAFLVGATLLVAAGALWSTAAVAGQPLPRTEFVYVAYAGVSHVLYALLEWRDIVGMLGQEGD
jgi:hypothetical protein